MSIEREARHWVKRLFLGILIVLSIVVVICAFLYDPTLFSLDIRQYFEQRLSHRTLKEWVVLLAPIVAFGIARIIHRLDEVYEGGGIRHRVLAIEGEHSAIDSAVLSATMTKQSVLAAIAAILLGIVQTAKGPLSQTGASSNSAQTETGLTPFPVFAAELSTIGFLVSILLLLVSIKCYDYANRFRLPLEYKSILIDKGLKLDIASWYSLLYSFVLGIACISEATSILMSILCAFLLWSYYFIHPEKK